jgi:tuftelin-interacting protein 11
VCLFVLHDLACVLISLLSRTPTFVSNVTEKRAATPEEDKEGGAMDEDGESIEEDSSSGSDDDEGDIPVFGSRRRESTEEDEEEEPPTRGLGTFRRGLGMVDTDEVPAVTPKSEPESPRGVGIGFKRGTGLPPTLPAEEPTILSNRGGIGARPPLVHATESPTMSTESLPTSFGASRKQRAFVRAAPTQATPIPKVDLSAEERAHFAKISGTFGAKMMAKMGWSAVRPCAHIRVRTYHSSRGLG